MTLRSNVALAGLPLLVLALVPLAALHCGNGLAPHSPSDAGVVVPPGTTDAGPAPAFTFSPKGCGYSVAIPTTRPFTDYALDDTKAASDPSGAAPVRVRVGLGGGTTKPAFGATPTGDGGAASPAYADPTTTAEILWETTVRTTNAKVRFGAAPGSFGTTQSGFVFTSPPPGAGFGSSDSPAYIHQVDLCGLTPGTTYYYQVGGGAAGSEIWSATQSFSTVPASGSKITVGIYGDARDVLSTWQLVNQRMRDAAPNLLLVSGDIVDIGSEESLFSQWLDAIWKDPSDAGGTGFLTLGQLMMVPVAGNHENDSSQFFANFAIPGEGPYAKQYASFDVGNTHFVMVDDTPIAEYPDAPMAAALLAWLEADLKAANADRKSHPFIVEINHRGLYSTSNHAADFDVLQARKTMAPLFTKYKVDLVMNGHDHEYERSKPLTAGTPPEGAPVVQPTVAQGTTYVINAGAGADPYAVGTSASTYRQGDPTAIGSLSTKGYLGCYAILTLEGQKMTLNNYGMKAGGGGVAGDDVIDTVVFGQ